MRKTMLGIALLGTSFTWAAAPATCPARGAAPARAVAVGESAHPAIVHVASREKTITIRSGPDGLLYSLAGADGKVLVADASGEAFARLYPELYHHLRNTIAVQNDAAGAWAGCD